MEHGRIPFRNDVRRLCRFHSARPAAVGGRLPGCARLPRIHILKDSQSANRTTALGGCATFGPFVLLIQDPVSGRVIAPLIAAASERSGAFRELFGLEELVDRTILCI